MAAYPARFQHDGQSADASRLGSQHQLHRSSHSSAGLSPQQSTLLPAHTNTGSTPQLVGSTDHVAPQQSHEEVGETSLMHQPVAAVTHTSSGSSACETLLSLCCHCQGICCTVPFCMIGLSLELNTPSHCHSQTHTHMTGLSVVKRYNACRKGNTLKTVSKTSCT